LIIFGAFSKYKSLLAVYEILTIYMPKKFMKYPG